ncbi:tape measure protein [Yersinia enterocolitica]|uniref:tape measure protein n=1 Tax=Yersinia enterocolitica TaxID=630 RepID=UPI003D023F7F
MAGEQQLGNIVYQVEMELGKLITSQQQVNSRLDQMEGKFDATAKSVDRAEKSMFSLSKVAGALTTALSVQQVASYAEAWTVLNNKLVNSIKTGETLADVNQRVFDIAQESRSSLDGIATLYSRMERAMRDAGVSGKELGQITTTISKAMTISGATAAESEGALVQLSQALASGVLRGQEFNSMSEQAPALMKGLSDSLGVTVGQLRAMAAEGKLTTDVVVNGLLKQSDAIAKEFGNTVLTMGQAFTVASNNITKFVGESSSVNTTLNVFNSSVISLSENLEAMGVVVAGAAVIFGGRYVGALALSAKATIGDTVAKIQNAKETAAATSVELRRAEAAKVAAKSELDKAQSRAAGARVTATSISSELTLAEAEAASIRVNLAQIDAEKALEAQRLKAQITDQGRIATATRMAQLQQASAALNIRLAQAETAAQSAKSASSVTGAAAIAAADAKVSAARLALADATGLATAANVRYNAAAKAASIASVATTMAVNGLKGAMALLGGPIGIVAAVAAGWYLYAQQQSEAKKESIAFANTLPDVISKLKEMNLAQSQGVRADTIDSIKNQKEAIADLESNIKGITADYNKYNGLAKQFGVTNDENNGYVIKAAEAANNLARANRDLDTKNKTLAASQEALKQINVQVNQGILDQMKAARDNSIALAEAESKTTTLANAQGFLAGKLGVSTDALQKFNAESLKINWGGSDGEKLIKQAERRLALSKLEGQEKVKQQALYDAEDAGVTDPGAIGKLQQVYSQTEANAEAKKTLAKETKAATKEETAAEAAEKRRVKSLQDLSNEMAVAELKTKGLNREAAQLAAVQDLGSGASQQQIQQATQQAGQIFDIQQRMADKKAAIDADSVAKAEQQRKLDLSQLDRQLAAGDISFEQSQQRRMQIAADYSKSIAEASANKAVTPQQEMAAQVDPVQALANENARKLALIQQFTQQKAITEQQGLALMNAANTQYEQARVAAQWEIFRNQSVGNESLAAAFDSLAGNASNAFTGIITQSMTAEEAMRSLASNAINSLINGFVQMGVEWVKSAITGSTAQVAATATTTAAAVAGTATTTAASVSSAAATTTAWTPAAIVASIGSFGGAAAIGIGAVVAAMALSGSLSGKRKNGGPVSAGSMYQVGEGGMPEIYQAGTGKQYMIPGDNGKVISNKDMQGSGSAPNVSIQFIDQSTGRKSFDAQSSMSGNNLTVTAFISDLEEGGPMSQSITRNTTASRRANG